MYWYNIPVNGGNSHSYEWYQLCKHHIWSTGMSLLWRFTLFCRTCEYWWGHLLGSTARTRFRIITRITRSTYQYISSQVNFRRKSTRDTSIGNRSSENEIGVKYREIFHIPLCTLAFWAFACSCVSCCKSSNKDSNSSNFRVELIRPCGIARLQKFDTTRGDRLTPIHRSDLESNRRWNLRQHILVDSNLLSYFPNATWDGAVTTAKEFPNHSQKLWSTTNWLLIKGDIRAQCNLELCYIFR